jgi:NTE family protein
MGAGLLIEPASGDPKEIVMDGTIAAKTAAKHDHGGNAHAFHAHGQNHDHADHDAGRHGMQADKRVNLALQGGGAHGAFTWGVLDRLLEDERIGFDGISATSAGAMNAAVLAYGLSVGGREGAKKALASFWRRVSHAAAFGPLQPTPLDRVFGNRSLESSPAFVLFDLMTRLFSPYQFNPLNFNPLRQVLEQTVDFEAIRRVECPVKLFLSATNVRSGKVRVFDNMDLTVDAVLASGCLPFMFQAVEIDGECYWDGGYMGNPAIFPLIYNCESTDVLIVHINPLEREELPHNATEIMNRINEISFNSSLMREMRAISFVTRLIDENEGLGNQLRRMMVHSIAADDVMGKLGVASKLNADWEFITWLKDTGRERADAWLTRNFDRLGRESTVDIRARYL